MLYAGAGAALSHQTAAELFKIEDRPDPRVHVTIPTRRRVNSAADLIIHRSSRVAEAIHPSLRPPRIRVEDTVLDLVEAAATFDEAVGVVCAACQRRLTTVARLSAAMSIPRKLRWRAGLAEALGDVGAGVQSLLEYRYLHLVELPHRLPRAVRQAKIGDAGRSRYLDNLYRDYGLCVELDGHPCETAVQIAAVLRSRGWPGQARPCAPACAARRQGRS